MCLAAAARGRPPWLLVAAAALAPDLAQAQQGGSPGPEAVAEHHPPLSVQRCAAGYGCSQEQLSVVLDANWRQLVAPDGETNCYEEGEWHAKHCADGASCASGCSLVGLGPDDYRSTYGVESTGDSLKLKYVNPTGSIGSRLYLMDGESSYKMFNLKNREFAFDVDVSNLPCGLNGALYLVEMKQDGGEGEGYNTAGARYGTGYCDAQCPKDLHFVEGVANVEGWDSEKQAGPAGSCCTEIDLWEANSVSAAFTGHPCSTQGPQQCSGVECGDTELGARYQGLCDKDGCDFNPWRMGSQTFFGPGMTVDTTQPLTVVTQFVTADGTDNGDLAEIRRYYVQNGRVIENPPSQVQGVPGNSITDGFCEAQKQAFVATRSKENPQGPFNHFAEKGGLRALGAALDRGMVFVLSLWDDSQAGMLWLDATTPSDVPQASPGASRGPCSAATGEPAQERAQFPDASAAFGNIRYGDLGSTTPGVPAPGAAGEAAAPGAQAPAAPPLAPAPPAQGRGSPLGRITSWLHALAGWNAAGAASLEGARPRGATALALAVAAASLAALAAAAARLRAPRSRGAHELRLYERMHPEATELEEQ